MANKNVYVIGIGGTGMRCIENFIHLCAIGMFDNTTVHMLAVDTDKDNGNFRRLSRLVDLYGKLNGGRMKSNTLFSAQVEYYQFSPDYSKSDCTFNKVIDKLSTTNTIVDDDSKARLSDLVDLFIRPEVGEMSLQHGYRAQTQMGSMLMYYAILAEAYKAKSQESVPLRKFLHAIVGEGGGAQIFVFGSVFGGTGASTIPVIPHAFAEAAKIMFGEGVNIIDGNHFGSVVLTNYFQFNIAHQDKVVAKSDKFALNSQAALRFYKNDKTVNEVYKRLYLIGREQMREVDSGGTGGASQCNPVDYLELMSAFAAYDFFKTCDTLGADPKAFEPNKENKFVFRAIESDKDNLSFGNFTDDADRFMQKLGIMTAASLLNTAYDYFENLRRDSVHFPEEDLKPLKSYFQLFGPEPYQNEQGIRCTGWLNQIFESAQADGFQQGAFFQPQLFNCETEKQFKDYKFNERLYNMETPHKFSVGMLTNKFSVVKDTFKDVKSEDDSGLGSLIERTYLTLRKLYFNE